LDPNRLYDPRHTTGTTPLHGKPKNVHSVKALVIFLFILLAMLAAGLVVISSLF
jgi:hypothetical protein